MSESPAGGLTPMQRALLGIRELREQLDDVERARTEPIAVIGIGCRLPGGATDPDSFWRLLHDGVDVIREMPGDRWEVGAHFDPDPEAPGKMNTRWGGFLDGIDQFDPAFFGISPWEAANMDPQQRLMLEVAQEAFDDAGQVRSRLHGSRTGVFIGLAHSEYGWLNFENPHLSNVYTATGSFGSIVANRLSYVYDLRGPSYTMDAVCSSSLLAVHQACESLRSGDCTMALAGGAGLFLRPEGFVWFSKLGVMASDGRCKAFDARGDGIVLGEGVAAVVLKTVSRALADGDPIHALLRGSAVAQDGRSNGLTAPSRLSQEAMLREAYRRAEVDPRQVQYVETHGTGTILGDPIEAQALAGVLGAGRDSDQALAIGSVKTNIGHLQMVGGLAGLIKVVLAMKHHQLPASLHFTQPNPHIPFEEYRLRVQDRLGSWPRRGPLLAGVTSLSFGGTNVHVVVEEAPRQPAGPAPATEPYARLLPLSAHTSTALCDLAGAYRRFVDESPALDLDDLCYTASLRRNHYGSRAAVPFISRADLLDRLAALQKQQARPGMSRGDRTSQPRRRLVFVFPGQGGQWIGMGRRLLEREPVFREAIEACATAMRPYVSWSLVDELRAAPQQSQLDRVDVVQPVTWAVQVALAAVWRAWGVLPDAVVGHSMGEVAAAHVAGTLSLDDAARVICCRSQLVLRVRGRGTMALVELPLEDARAAIHGHADRLAVAASNGPTSTVLSGDTDAIDAVLLALAERDVFCRRINVDFASHSSHVDELRPELLRVLREVRPREAVVPIYSTVSGQLTDGREYGAEYWVRNLREPVLFAAAVQRLIEGGHTLFIELSPHPVLLPSIERSADHLATPVVALPSLQRDEDERSVLLGTLGTLYTVGQPVDWNRQHPAPRTVVRLPGYPWQRQRCWLEFAPGGTRGPGQAPLPAGGAADRYFQAAEPGAEHFWELPVDRGWAPEVGDPRHGQAAVLPAAAYLDMVLTAATALLDAPRCVLTDVTLEQPLALAGADRIAQVAIGSMRGGGCDWHIFSRPAGVGAPAGGWVRHARGTLRPASGASQPYLPQHDAPEAVRSRCTAGIPGTAYYDSRAAAGSDVAPRLRAVRQLWRRDGELLALLGDPADEGQRQAAPDWGRLHSAFELLAMAAPGAGTAAGGYRPTAVERLRVFGPVAGDLWAHAVLREIGVDDVTGEIRLLDADLRVVAEVSGLRLHLAGGDGAVAAPGGTVVPVAAAPTDPGETAGREAPVPGASGQPPTSHGALLAVRPADRHGVLTAYLRDQIAAVLGLRAPQLDVDQPLTGLGLNSLMVFELRNRLRVMYGAKIAPERFLAGVSVAGIVDEVLAHVVDAAQESGAAPGVPAAQGPAAQESGAAPGAAPGVSAAEGPAAGPSLAAADWLVRRTPRARPRLRLFCLPYAGGSALAFRTWCDELPAEVDVCPIQLPGREQRYREPAFTQMSALVTALSRVLRTHLDLPFAFYGHSLGGLIGYELARQLRREGLPLPAHLYVSATRAPQLPDPEPPMHRLPDARLIDKLRAMNGTPGKMLDDRDAIALYLPVLRADLALVETYVHRTEPPLDCPVTVFGGVDDAKVPEGALVPWSSQTRGDFSLTMLPGDHFFIQKSRTQVLAELTRLLVHDMARLDDRATPAEL